MEKVLRWMIGSFVGIVMGAVTVVLFFKDTRNLATKGVSLGEANAAQISTLKVDVVKDVSRQMLFMHIDMMEKINARFDEQSKRLNRIEHKIETQGE